MSGATGRSGRARQHVAPGWRREVARVLRKASALAHRKRPLHVLMRKSVLVKNQTRGKSGPSGLSALNRVALAVERDANVNVTAIVRVSKEPAPFKCGNVARRSLVQSPTQVASGRPGLIGLHAMEHVRWRPRNDGATVATAGESVLEATRSR